MYKKFFRIFFYGFLMISFCFISEFHPHRALYDFSATRNFENTDQIFLAFFLFAELCIVKIVSNSDVYGILLEYFSFL